MIESLLANRNFTDFVLEPETLAEAVVMQVLSGYGSQLIPPAACTSGSSLRREGVPIWLQESMRNGMNQALKG